MTRLLLLALTCLLLADTAPDTVIPRSALNIYPPPSHDNPPYPTSVQHVVVPDNATLERMAEAPEWLGDWIKSDTPPNVAKNTYTYALWMHYHPDYQPPEPRLDSLNTRLQRIESYLDKTQPGWRE